MQEWIIAMLVISVLLILRDMAKTILTGRMSKKEEAFSLCEEHPQKEKVERYAASFQKLADTFYGMPYKKEFLSSGRSRWQYEIVRPYMAQAKRIFIIKNYI